MTVKSESIQVGLAERSYQIIFGQGILPDLGAQLNRVGFPKRVALVSNPAILGHYGQRVLDSLASAGYDCSVITVPDGEEYKNLTTLESIYDQLIIERFDRSSGLIALGGGVVGDMAGYAAATFLRGVPFVQIPTTVLAQVDSSVGGKTAVNHRLGKNLIGAFYQPKLVLIDIETLQTLETREISAGIAEIVKYGVIRDSDFFDWLEENAAKLLALDPEALLHAVKRSCQIKADIVEIDEREGSVRALLNYGHTFGHAIESLCGYGDWRHGEAVACGMIVAARIALNMGLSDEGANRRVETLLRRFQLPVDVPVFGLNQYVDAMCRDKKMRQGSLTLVLNLGIGNAELFPIEDVDGTFRAVLPELEAKIDG